MTALFDDQVHQQLMKDQAFEEGYDAFQSNLKRTDNPYCADVNGEEALWESWRQGFARAENYFSSRPPEIDWF